METTTIAEFRCCNGTYRRDAAGIWRYPWDEPVPGASDLTLADVLGLPDRAGGAASPGAEQPIDREARAWLTEHCDGSTTVLIRRRVGRAPTTDQLVVGMSAPELQLPLMLTNNDLAELLAVSKQTVASYRYRGYLPEPQAVRGRTPLWARPIIARWLRTRPGSSRHDDGRHTTKRRTPARTPTRG